MKSLKEILKANGQDPALANQVGTFKSSPKYIGKIYCPPEIGHRTKSSSQKTISLKTQKETVYPNWNIS